MTHFKNILKISLFCFVSNPLNADFSDRNLSYNAETTLNCSTLIGHTWNYPSSDVAPFCNEAEISCLRLGLIRKAVKLAEKYNRPNELNRLKKDLKISLYDVQIKLRGCQLALDVANGGIMKGNDIDISEAAGFKK